MNPLAGPGKPYGAAPRPVPEPLYRMLPAVHELLLTPALARLCEQHSRESLVSAARTILGGLRTEIGRGEHTEASVTAVLARIEDRLAAELKTTLQPSLRPVINATGVLLHTNLGRAPLSQAALAHIAAVASGYSNLELDLATGQRGRRDRHAESLVLHVLAQATGSAPEELEATHGVVVVNNCAAATFLALNSLAEGREVLVSRGELVEIGGGFRIPDILRKSGAHLREVGTTNRTRIADYRRELSAQTGLILRVHQSNFKIEGFTERPALGELLALGREHNLPVFVDQGTGLLLAPEELGVDPETSLTRTFEHDPDLVAASGDKLLGGPQCGLLIGRKPIVERLRANPLLRTYRVDKLTYAAMEATLLSYLAHREHEIPLIRMLRIPSEELRARCTSLALLLAAEDWNAEVIPSESVIGGGTTPGKTLPGFALSLRHASQAAPELLAALRRQTPPLIARIENDRLLLDLRAVPPSEDGTALQHLRRVGSEQKT